MKPDKLTVFELFDKQRQYTVPLFQRSYRWTEDKQWVPLWADIEREAKTAFIRLSRQEPLTSTHFMGAVVLSVQQILGRGIAKVQIIDGQQRLITLQIVLAALRDYAAPLDENLSQDAAHLTRNNSRADLSRDDVLKVRPSSSNRTMFHKVMSAQSVTQIRADHLKTAAQRKSDASRIAAAYVFFYDKIHQFVSSKLDGSDPTESDRSERLYAIFHAFRTSFQVVTIDLEGTDDPQMIFETLNDRGEPLLASDLIRNWIFMMAERRGSDLNALYSEYWNHYETRRVEANDDNSDLFWHKKEGRGRDSRSRIDRLIFYDLMIRKTRKSMNAEISQHTIGHLFRDFRAFMEESLGVKHGNALQTYLGELQVRSDHYASLVHPEGYELEPSFARRLKALDVGTLYPVLLYLKELGPQRVPPDHWRDVVAYLESYLVRRTVCGLDRKGYGDLFGRLLVELHEKIDAGQSAARVVFETLDENRERRYVWPGDKEFIREWINRPIYRASRQEIVSAILTALNDHMRRRGTEGERPTGLTIEHLMPQKWSPQDYPYPDEANRSDRSASDIGVLELVERQEDDEHETVMDRRARLLHTIGNLTLLTRPLNSQVSNGRFEDKARQITEETLLFLNGCFRGKKDWDEVDIVQRSKELSDRAVKIWPRPATGPDM